MIMIMMIIEMMIILTLRLKNNDTDAQSAYI